jgi:hypothetical protein
VVPDYSTLISNPDRALREHAVHIAGARRYGSVFAGTLLFVMIVWIVSCMAFLTLLDWNPRKGIRRLIALLILAVWLVTPFVTWFAVKRFFAARAGNALLNRDGVTLWRSNEIVFCPWELFATTGNPVRGGAEGVLVPVAAEAVAGIMIERGGNIDNSGSIKTRLLTYTSGNQIALRQSYEVDVVELAALFLHLGKSLAVAPPLNKSARSVTSAETDGHLGGAWQERGGWIGAYVSRLSFPPRCCSCGTPASTEQVIHASNSSLMLRVPVCSRCLRQGKRQSWAYLLLGLALAAILFLGLMALTLILVVVTPGLGLLSVLPTVIVPAMVGLWSVSRSRRAATPVETRRWSSADGTVQFRFRWPEYGEALLAGRSPKVSTIDSDQRQPDPQEGS